jgi:hypothetical protein
MFILMRRRKYGVRVATAFGGLVEPPVALEFLELGRF